MPTFKTKFETIDELIETTFEACKCLNNGAESDEQIIPEQVINDLNSKKLKQLFNKQALRSHSDKNGSGNDEKMKEINGANDALRSVIEVVKNADSWALIDIELELESRLLAKVTTPEAPDQPHEVRELAEDEHKVIFMQQLARFNIVVANAEEKISCAGDMSITDFFADKSVVENLRILSFKKKIDIDALTDIYITRVQGHPKRADIFAIFSDPTFITKDTGTYFDSKEAYRLQKYMDSFFKKSEPSFRQDDQFKFMERSDLPYLHKFYLFYYFCNLEHMWGGDKLNNSLCSSEALKANSESALFFEDIKWQLIKENLNKHIDHLMSNKLDLVTKNPDQAFCDDNITQLNYIVFELYHNDYLAIVNDAIVHPILKQREKLNAEKMALLSEANSKHHGASKEKMNELHTKVNIIDNKIKAANDALHDIKDAIISTVKTGGKLNDLRVSNRHEHMPEPNYKKGDANYSVHKNTNSPDHLHAKIKSVVEKYAYTPGAKKSQKPLGDFFRGLLGVFVGIVISPVLLVSSGARNKFMHTFYYTKTQTTLRKGISDADTAANRVYVEKVHDLKKNGCR